MYVTKTAVGRGYTVAYPEFDGDGMALANKFYERLARCAEEYFISLINEDRRSVCKAAFTVEESDSGFAVDYVLTLRRCGRRCGEKRLTHRWHCYKGRDAVLDE